MTKYEVTYHTKSGSAYTDIVESDIDSKDEFIYNAWANFTSAENTINLEGGGWVTVSEVEAVTIGNEREPEDLPELVHFGGRTPIRVGEID